LNLEHWERYPTYKQIKIDISNLDLSKMKVLEISAGEYWRENFKFRSYNSLNYPEYDICKTININQKFDLIIADNVWEHIKYPNKATKNVFNLLNDGGYFLLIVPFMIRVHEVPIDCTRWTEDGLRFHLEECGFQLNNIFTNSWGNKSCVSANLRSDDTWARIWFFRSLKNDKKFPVQVWALAKK
jgi:SAM-dependent methyltransferase